MATWTEVENALKTALVAGSGVARVRYPNGQEVEHRSVSEIADALAKVRQLAREEHGGIGQVQSVRRDREGC